MRRAVRALLVVVTLGALVMLFVLPGRTWWEQRSAISNTQHQISVLSKENKELQKKASQLQDASYIEQIARQEYGLVSPGQVAYGIIPPRATTTTSTTTTTAPSGG